MTPDQKGKSLPGRVVRGTSRASVGAGALLIGLALFLLFRGFGPGGTGLSGSGTSSAPGAGEKTMITKDGSGSGAQTETESSDKSLAAPETVAGGLTEDEKKALSGDVFTVLIDEHDFLIELPGTSDPVFRPSTLDRVVELATLARGDSNGIRVKILRRESSRASAEFQLKTELERLGLRSDAIIMPGEFVP